MRLIPPKNHGVLGINARNLTYLKPHNPAKAVAFADDKLKTKVFLETRGIPVPKLYAKISTRDELRAFNFNAIPDACALKPNFGYGGEGILVLTRREEHGWRTATGKRVSEEEVFEHIEDILDGMYSLNHRRDSAFFEQLITSSDVFSQLGPTGLPDIRIIVFNLVPVMAMLRIPTKESDGKANVHLGGIGLGIDIAKGVTTFGVQRNRRIETLPNGRATSGFKIPHWEELLLNASRIQQMTNIGFLGVDFTIDRDMGPALLEVNARAGLMVQIANLAPLQKRLERVEGLKVGSPEKGVRMAQDLFGEKLASKNAEKEAVGKPVLGTVEIIEVLGGKKQLLVPAVLRPDYDRTVFDPLLVAELKELDALEETQDGTYRVKFSLGGKKLQTVVHVVPIREDDREIRASIGKRDLAGFLVDPAKKAVASPLHPVADLSRIDTQLADIDRKVQLIRNLRPENIEEERSRAESDASYNPKFTYADLSFDSAELYDRLKYLESDASPLGILLEKKRMEIMQKIDLLDARGNSALFTERSGILFGFAGQSLVKEARAFIGSRPREEISFGGVQDLLPADEAKKRFEAVLQNYGLHEWSVNIRPLAIADVTIGRKSIILRDGGLFTEERIRGLIAHEIETHVITAENGARQPYALFERGMAGYLETQEGLAVWNQNAVLSDTNEKRYWPAMNVLAVHYALTHSFADLRRYIRRLGFDDARALQTCIKVKRGLCETAFPGAFTKEIVYFRGWKLVQEYLQGGGDLKALYIGKVNLRDLSLVQKMQNLLIPSYLPKER